MTSVFVHISKIIDIQDIFQVHQTGIISLTIKTVAQFYFIGTTIFQPFDHLF